MIIIGDPFNGLIFGNILVMIGFVTYRILDWVGWFDTPPTAFTFIWYVPIVDGGTIVDIVVSVNDVIPIADSPNITFKGFWAVL